jgi:hypothetical protein
MYAEVAFQMTILNGMKNVSSRIRVNPIASNTTMVISSALAIVFDPVGH